MSQINRPPRGLQDLLGSQNLGQNPADLAVIVQPTVDMLPYWAIEAQLVFAQTAGNLGAPAAVINSYTVPNGEIWFPITMSGQGAYNAPADQGGFHLETVRSAPLGGSLSQPVILASVVGPAGLVIGHQFSVAFSWPRLVGYPSGCLFRSVTDFNVVGVGPTVCETSLHYLRLRA